MSNQDDFQQRLKRVKGRARNKDFNLPEPGQQRHREDFDAEAMILAIMRPQLAFILGVAALIAGRSIAMHVLGVEPSTDLLGWGEGIVVFVLLVIIGLLFGMSDHVSHGALIVGATLAFMLEGHYIPAIPGLMEQVYTPEYVGLVVLGLQ